EPQQALSAVFDMDRALGLGLKAALDAASQPEDSGFVQKIGEIIQKRAEAKKAKDFAGADRLRQELKDLGIALEDGPGGTTWRRIR
ncbi:MAG: cysteine--tRNA ligase, partial [Treponema sp.]|nr:cysteine--tRNA ligase [Treponema sp.]